MSFSVALIVAIKTTLMFKGHPEQMRRDEETEL